MYKLLILFNGCNSILNVKKLQNMYQNFTLKLWFKTYDKFKSKYLSTFHVYRLEKE